ncbi:MAG: DUF1289 domain-containing protein [Rhodospirillales bacterium]|nr:DUF1289 domain-containing protein [Rhodospirillales bacterium]MBO6785689.1 DUF1289 domain-containing protein [Rhodospirillales bacterium]
MSTPQHVESPCISICELDGETGLCRGCWRTRDEIAMWARADAETRLAILEKLRERRAQAGGGRRRETRRRRNQT